MVATARGAFLARVEGSTSEVSEPAKLVVSRVAPDGSFGPAISLSDAKPEALGGVSLTATPAGFSAVWVEGASLRLSSFDPDGVVTRPARDLALPDVSIQARPLVAAGPDGSLGIVYRVMVEGQPSELRFVAVDAAGSALSPTRCSAGMLRSMWNPALRSRRPKTDSPCSGAGRQRPGDRSSSQRPTSKGSRSFQRTRCRPLAQGAGIGGAAIFAPTTTSILPVEGGYLAAWTETHEGPEWNSGAWSIVRIARLSRSGALEGPELALREPVADFDEVEPSLVHFGEAVAVFWARGTHTYVCGGCIPDHRIDLILIDPAALAPVSNLVSVGNGGGRESGGLLRREAVVLGSSLLTTFNLTFHVQATPGSATFICERK
jgi:hypothetical protein